jgi:hypothetical protein
MTVSAPHNKKPLSLALGGCLLFGACAPAPAASSDRAEVTYALERVATGAPRNALHFDFSAAEADEPYRIRLAGSGFTADVALDEIVDIQDTVEFTLGAEGDYSVDMEIFQPNGTPYIEETLSWSYSTVIPEPPILSFTEEATNDVDIGLLVAASRAEEDTEIWVEGEDLAGDHAAGYWDTLSDSGIYLLKTTADDGVKSMSVKLRNIYGMESELVDASILKKSTPPTDCRAETAAGGSDSSSIAVQLFAVDTGPVFYAVFGDTREDGEFTEFTSGDTVTVDLTGGEGVKTFTVQIRDLAGNYCDEIEKTVTVSADYSEAILEVDGTPLWTDAATVDLNIRFDHYPSEEPFEMILTGDIAGANVGTWIDYDTTATVAFMAGAGDKRIHARVRDKDGTETYSVGARIYYTPGVSFTNAGGADRNVIVSDIYGMTNVTITGCTQTFNQVAYAASYFCTPSGGQVSVLYKLDDGTSFTRSGNP